MQRFKFATGALSQTFHRLADEVFRQLVPLRLSLLVTHLPQNCIFVLLDEQIELVTADHWRADHVGDPCLRVRHLFLETVLGASQRIRPLKAPLSFCHLFLYGRIVIFNFLLFIFGRLFFLGLFLLHFLGVSGLDRGLELSRCVRYLHASFDASPHLDHTLIADVHALSRILHGGPANRYSCLHLLSR